ncbi:MAG: hypothetical protein CYPHOPRED_005042 [Cyphobasidiales sp. Tagirdzhanova-0007]|nr:MAG: hypothetical protein CYPHOPRED_005042 [Cyphobasidiales sp. Tagirdzhanova-0007]
MLPAPSSSGSTTTRQGPGLTQLLHWKREESTSSPALQEARLESSIRLQRAWESICERYERDDHLARGRDDVYDLETGEIVEDGGYLKTGDVLEVGAFGLPGAMGMDDTSEDDEDGEDEEEHSEEEGLEGKGGQSEPIEVSSSEDELSNWTLSAQNVHEPSQQYWKSKRAKEMLERDVEQFLRKEAGRLAGLQERAASVIPARRFKLESVKPVSFSGGLPSPSASVTSQNNTIDQSRLHLSKLSRSRHTPSSSIAPESKPSSGGYEWNSSIINAKNLHPSPSSSHTVSATVRMAGGNDIRTQAMTCEDDSSDDDLTLLSSLDLGLNARILHKTPVECDPSSLTEAREIFPSPPSSRSASPIKPKLSPSLPLSSPSPSKRCPSKYIARLPSHCGKLAKMEPVVEIFVSPSPSCSALPSTKYIPANVRTLGRSASSVFARPTHSSPLKESSIISHKPPVPRMSRTSRESSMEGYLRCTPPNSSDSEDDLNLAQRLVRSAPIKSRKRISLTSSPTPFICMSSTATSPAKLSSLNLNKRTDPSYNFSKRPSLATTSASCSAPDTPVNRIYHPATSTAEKKKACTRSPPPVYKRGEEPWRIKRHLPTPPPSLTSDPSLSPSRVIKLPKSPRTQMEELWAVSREEEEKDSFIAPLPSRTKRPLPTPPLSSTSDPSLSPSRLTKLRKSLRMEMEEPRAVSKREEEKDVFTAPTARPNSLCFRQNLERSMSPNKRVKVGMREAKDIHTVPDSASSEEDDILLTSPTRPVRMIESIPGASYRQAGPATPRLSCMSVATSTNKRRLGSVLRPVVRVPPPDDNGDESDDPLAI